ncbi:MAG: hypothetical protein ALECFALPRED_000869 [Alectoria fallacina]|uniref:Uncharacterized protein n=1 Tax=Alectoria fallacina TaxID=1903189 RepID=A0A8H3F8A5_9LECA|nr:MAG: hypothetical protein ALECFALPRED_000869 [Alectoria fallacina]
MLWSNRYFNCLNSLCALLLSSQPIVGTGFVPRDVAAGETIERRLCDPAAPDVSESSIVADFCNQTLTNDSPTCSDQVTVHIQQSATNTCGQYFGLFTDCLMANDGDHTACSDSLFGYQNCNNYTMQAYAYCGCYYTLPASLADCANEQLQPQPPDIAMVPTTSAPVTAIPDIVVSAASADKEPTPAVLAVSEGAASSSSQSTTSFSDPQPSSSPTAHILSFKWNMPSSNPGTAWTQIAAPSTSTERITVVVTYTTTFITAGYTTTAILTSTSISTEYTCADGGDVKIAVSAADLYALLRRGTNAEHGSKDSGGNNRTSRESGDLYLSVCGGASVEVGGWTIRGNSRENWECGVYEVSKKVEDILKD